jgi:hypothetical protein
VSERDGPDLRQKLADWYYTGLENKGVVGRTAWVVAHSSLVLLPTLPSSVAFGSLVAVVASDVELTLRATDPTSFLVFAGGALVVTYPLVWKHWAPSGRD